MTQYFVDVSPQIAQELLNNDQTRPMHFHMLKKVAREGVAAYERWLVEDGSAPAAVENCLIEVTLSKRLNELRAIISSRHILQRYVNHG